MFSFLQHHYAQSIQRSNDVEESGGSYIGGDGVMNGPKNNSKALTGKMQALSREARSNQRRLLTAFGIDTDSDLLKFNQLKVGYIIQYQLILLMIRIFQYEFHVPVP